MDNVTLIRIVAGVMALLVIPVIVVPFSKIFSRAEFPGVLSLAMIVSLANLIAFYDVALAQWNVKPKAPAS